MVKVVGFDSWTKGAHHFERLVAAFEQSGIALRLVHLGSWGNDPNRRPVERIGSLEVHDISYYGGSSLEAVLDVEKPAAVILLSTQTFAHRAFMRYCRRRGIPTLLLYHGLASMQVTSDAAGSFKIDRLAYARYVCSKLGKLLRHTLPCYASALWKTGASARDWGRFAADIGRMAKGKGAWLVATADDARSTRCAVYTSADVEHAKRIFGFTDTEVVAVGNPDLVRFGASEALFGCTLRRSSLRGPIMYIDTGLAATGLVFEGQRAFVRHLIRTGEALRNQGRAMYFKPHPAHDLARLTEQLAGAGIQLVSNDDFVASLLQCEACIVEPTTLALIPCLAGMPILRAGYGDLHALRYGPVLVDYPRSYALRDVNNASRLLEIDRTEFNAERTIEWIRVNAGPLPAERMPQRVVALVRDLCTSRLGPVAGGDGLTMRTEA
jgi:hypothetical protein